MVEGSCTGSVTIEFCGLRKILEPFITFLISRERVKSFSSLRLCGPEIKEELSSACL